MDVPEGWLKVIRGPRPPSVQWPAAPPREPVPRGRWRQGPQQFRQPGSVHRSRVQQDFQVGIYHGGPRRDNISERTVLEAALKKAMVQAVIPPVSEQIDHTEKFIKRAKKRQHAEEYVQWAQEWKVECEKELMEAEERLLKLRISDWWLEECTPQHMS